MGTADSQRIGAGLAGGGSRRIVLAVAIGAIALDTALLGLIAPLLPEIRARTGTSEAGLGLALAAYSLPILFVSVPFGRAADRLGRRPLLLGGLLLTTVGSVVIAFSDALLPLIAGRAIQGIGSAASWIAALALVSDLAPPGRKGEAIGFALAANSVGAIGGPALGGVGNDLLGYEAPFLIVGTAAVLLVLAGARVLPAGAPGSSGDAFATMRRILRLPAVLPAALISVGAAAALGLIEVVVPLDVDERLGLSAAAIGGLFAATIALDALAAPIAGRRSDISGRPPIAAAGLGLVGLSGVLLALLGGVPGVLAGLAVFGVGISASFAAAVPWLDDSFGGVDRGIAFAGLNILYSLGYTLGPLLGGGLLELVDPELAYWLLAGCALAAALALVARGSDGRASGEPAAVSAPSEAGAADL
jgi:MFS transporter, DHA1 family, solute carrier family 18 (vesicular amine transporter), member 1/2